MFQQQSGWCAVGWQCCFHMGMMEPDQSTVHADLNASFNSVTQMNQSQMVMMSTYTLQIQPLRLSTSTCFENRFVFKIYLKCRASALTRHGNTKQWCFIVFSSIPLLHYDLQFTCHAYRSYKITGSLLFLWAPKHCCGYQKPLQALQIWGHKQPSHLSLVSCYTVRYFPNLHTAFFIQLVSWPSLLSLLLGANSKNSFTVLPWLFCLMFCWDVCMLLAVLH